MSRIGDCGDHTSATLITGSWNHTVDNISLVRIGDIIFCGEENHNANPIISVNYGHSSGNLEIGHIGAISGCGCQILTGSYTTFRG